MQLFEEVFSKASIYDMLFFSVKAVLEHPTLNKLKEENPVLYERWKYLSKTKYSFDIDTMMIGDAGDQYSQKIYEDKAVFYPEFSKIVTITYASVAMEDNALKRYIKKIADDDEFVIINNFMAVLQRLSSEGAKGNPQYFPTLCGHNIINYDIPLLIKRLMKYRDKYKDEEGRKNPLPYILKKCLNAKPWEGGVVDTVNAWKFNGNDYSPLMLIADYLGLKKTVDLDSLPEVSWQYWNIMGNPESENAQKDAVDYVALQSATQVNLVIQLINELRQF